MEGSESPLLLRVKARVDRTAQARERVETTMRELVEAMVAAREEGHSLQEIAEAAGMSRQRVHQILGGDRVDGDAS